jgi:hypothetical protein
MTSGPYPSPEAATAAGMPPSSVVVPSAGRQPPESAWSWSSWSVTVCRNWGPVRPRIVNRPRSFSFTE